MNTYLVNRLLQSLLLLALVSVIGFFILHLAPGGPLSQYVATPGMTSAQLAHIAAQMGLNRPLPEQYLAWVTKLLVGNWGVSYRDGRSVLAVIGDHVSASVQLMLVATAISVVIGTAVGVAGALRQHSVADHLSTVGAMVGLSIPTFWIGLVAIYIFSIQLHWLPAGDMYTIGHSSLMDYVAHLIMPALVLALANVAMWSRYMRAATLDVLHQEFIRTARAKGVRPFNILRRHIMRNALLPMITLGGMQLPTLLSGAVVTETVFTWPGLGRLFLDSLEYKDYPVIMGLLMFSAILVIVGNLAADLLVMIVDPRIRG